MLDAPSRSCSLKAFSFFFPGKTPTRIPECIILCTPFLGMVPSSRHSRLLYLPISLSISLSLSAPLDHHTFFLRKTSSTAQWKTHSSRMHMYEVDVFFPNDQGQEWETSNKYCGVAKGRRWACS